MSGLLLLALACLLAALLCAALTLVNGQLYRPAPPLDDEASLPGVSVLIPARNEAASIGAALDAARATRGVPFEIVVLDDHSQDATAEIVAQEAARDPRVRLERAPPLPSGWCGKQHACHVLAQRSTLPVLLFLDADVRIAPHAAARIVGFLRHSRAALVSGVPRQETGSLLERLWIPLIHFLLLGYLPFWIMRRSLQPGLGAGCGQLFATTRENYERSGGHAAIRETLHDGIRLPRQYRAAGLSTDLFDATDLAVCRMYRSSRETWRGLLKNATEGLASPRTIGPFTLLLGLGHVLPGPLLVIGLTLGDSGRSTAGLATVALVLSYVPRLWGCIKYRQSWLGAALHPLGVASFLALQWYALARCLAGRPVSWKQRDYDAAATRSG